MTAPFVEADATRVLNEPLLRRVLLGVALVGLAIGLAVWRLGYDEVEPRLIWAAATIPVVTVLVISIIRDFWIGRFGVDAIALVSMSAALVLGEALAAIVVAIMYAGGTVLEDFARGRAERNLTALTDRSPRVAHRQGWRQAGNCSGRTDRSWRRAPGSRRRAHSCGRFTDRLTCPHRRVDGDGRAVAGTKA